jgi:hypothetical protein
MTEYNGEVTSYFYNDPLDRLTNETRPAGAGYTNYSYSPAGSFSCARQDTGLESGVSTFATTHYDGLADLADPATDLSPRPLRLDRKTYATAINVDASLPLPYITSELIN